MFDRLIRRCQQRKPDVIIGERSNPYLLRWWVIPKNPFFNVFLHRFLRSDDDRALHSHPWAFNASVLLGGTYREHTPKGEVQRWAGNFYLRLGAAWHRVELTDGPVWTLFITGPKVREWGFACQQGFRHWRDYTAMVDGANVVGRGCD